MPGLYMIFGAIFLCPVVGIEVVAWSARPGWILAWLLVRLGKLEQRRKSERATGREENGRETEGGKWREGERMGEGGREGEKNGETKRERRRG